MHNHSSRNPLLIIDDNKDLVTKIIEGRNKENPRSLAAAGFKLIFCAL